MLPTMCKSLVISVLLLRRYLPCLVLLVLVDRECSRGSRANSEWRGVSLRHAGLVRPRSATRSASDGEADNILGESWKSEGQEGSSGQAPRAAWEEDMEEADDAPELTEEFYKEVRYPDRYQRTVSLFDVHI